MRASRAFDLLLAGSILFWGARGWLDLPDRTAPVALAILALQVCVALLLVGRREERRAASTSALALSIPAVLIGALVYGAAPAMQLWSTPATVAFVIGSAVACVSLGTLGRSFAILPGVRRIVVRGPYRVVRHPAYFGEGIMVAAAAAMIGGVLGLSLALFAAALLYVRIVAEERVLADDAVYRDYAQTVRWRLLPGLW